MLARARIRIGSSGLMLDGGQGEEKKSARLHAQSVHRSRLHGLIGASVDGER